MQDFPGGLGQGRWPTEDLPPGRYAVEAQALSPEGREVATARQHFQVFPRPPWWKNELGLDHSVPPPFTPVQENHGIVSVWGRDLTWGSRAFPQQITRQGVPLFTRPPTFLLRTGGQEGDLARLPRQGREAFPDRISFTGSGQVGEVAVSLRSTVEFDGCTRYDLTLTPAQATAIEELTLTLPFPPEQVQFLQASTGASGNVLAFDREFRSGFLPYLWLGNDDGGLAFFAESDQFWTPHDQKMLQVISHPQETVLQAHFIAEERTLNAPITFTFGLMATPIRPIPHNDPYAYPSYDHKGSIAFPEFLTYPVQEDSLAVQGTLEFWCRRSQSEALGNTELFHLVGGKQSLHAYLITPDEPDLLALFVDRQPLLEARVPLTGDSWTHLAMVWDAEALAVYSQGQLVGRTEGSAFREALAQGLQQLRFGCQSDWQGYTGLLLDEIRLSRCVRYRGDSFPLPSAPFEPDADTVLLDPLEESFQPDGQDGRTRGGGTPSIGAVWEAGKFGQGLKLEVAPPRPALEVMREMGIRVVSHWGWQEPMQRYYAQPVLFGETVPGLQEEVAEYHRYGIAIIPYAAYPAVGGPSPLVEQFGDEWGLRPVSTLPWQFPGAPEGYHLYNCCLQARGFADYLVGGAAWLMDSFGFDGIYTDGLAHVYACQNLAHGCGYLDEQGHLHSTWPIFATREALKRLYRVIKSRKPDGFLVNHASFSYLMPTLAFSDILYTGEHEDYENLLNARVRFNSRPWGLYVTTLGSSEHVYSPLHTMTSLLHGVSIWGSGLLGRRDFGRKEARIWQAYRAFETATAEWVPYFQGENRYYQVSEPEVKASLYVHPGRNVLLLVGNYHREAQAVHLRLDLARLGLAGKALAGTNVLTAVAVPVSEAGDLHLEVPAKSFVLLRIESRP